MNLFSPKWPLEGLQSLETLSSMHANQSLPGAQALAVEQDSLLESLQDLSQNAAVLEEQHVDV